jgi:small subunit ribosomal protein S3
MIERKTIKKKMDLFLVEKYISDELDKPGYSHTEIQRTPLGEKILIYTSKPGLIVGRGGSTIKELTETLKKRFKLENPQIEVNEIESPFLDASSVARSIVHSFDRFGPRRFKLTGYRTLKSIMDAGALGAEIVIAGRGVPSSRSRTWRFSAGYLKKSGDISENHTERGMGTAHLKSGSIGIKVSILTPDVNLPDKVKIYSEEPIKVEEITEKVEAKVEAKAEEKKEAKTEEKKEVKVEVKVEEKKETKAETKIEEKKEAKVEAKSEEKKETKVEERAEEKVEKVPTAAELKEKKTE